ncbi:hypothetical protein ESY86_09585 [Subsaximicrobium wynnwilliamsii]|uniref:Uncharacterized protein n=1 Tax=Subsaximicrobium wynnwilliamsii TaxID=291179 RepID=A0A5C6ZJP5_9FLAO|nr:hypothetical protein [Subsaximicrobium wynnwilliamsii]TXD83443.1 hypothetical protein ESY87_09225 [Subsaximicrobium wynnwilliamsii]TXD89282.1 hypothetical protein ESY86_09585 [Subsaximicrobium wynnwilliamsii]TXE03123.1 hypothetical protein ESY88_08935 [Subsaximicrobium wynnwilliamsii]
MKNFILVRQTFSKKSFVFLVIIMHCIMGYSQIPLGQTSNEIETDLPTIIPPSPTVATLMRFEEVPVDHYTGIPDISVPLYSKKVSNNLNFNIGLSYNPVGIRVADRSGWTGTG